MAETLHELLEHLERRAGTAKVFMLWLRDPGLPREVRGPRLQRAIGVIYRPGTERASHYFEARVAEQLDVMIHIDETRALRPLELASAPSAEPAQTYPTGQ